MNHRMVFKVSGDEADVIEHLQRILPLGANVFVRVGKTAAGQIGAAGGAENGIPAIMQTMALQLVATSAAAAARNCDCPACLRLRPVLAAVEEALAGVLGPIPASEGVAGHA